MELNRRLLNVDAILKDNSANLLHTGDNKKADKWTHDIRCTVMVFDETFAHEDILNPFYPEASADELQPVPDHFLKPICQHKK